MVSPTAISPETAVSDSFRNISNRLTTSIEEIRESHPVEQLYVGTLLFLLPTLLNVCRHICKDIKVEKDYLEPGFTFEIRVQGTPLSCICQKTERGAFRRVQKSQIASDVEAGSGVASSDPNAVTIDYVINFRSISYAFECFTGNTTLKRALAERAFSTRGPNDCGVALTYMFTALLTIFFFWRDSYRQTNR